VRVSLSLRLWWIVAIAPNPPYAVPYIDPPYGRTAYRVIIAGYKKAIQTTTNAKIINKVIILDIS